nr:histidine kinase [Pseudomonas sp.]
MAGLRSFALATAGTLAVCTLIAAGLAALVPAVGGFHAALVNSVCIGMIAHMLIHGGWRWLWHGGEPPALGMTLLCVASVLVAIWLGAHAAAVILGKPAAWLSSNAGGVRIAALLATIGGTTSVAGVIWLRQYLAALRLRAQLEQARADAAARLADEARLRMLRAQLEPHMLFNTLATLRALIEMDAGRAQVMLDHLVSFLRTTLGASRADEISLDMEFSLLDSYLSLMSIRMGPRLRYRLTLAPELQDCRVPPMLIQPIVENAIRHGLEPMPGGGSIDILAERRDDRIEISVRDTGEGFAPDAMGAYRQATPDRADNAGFGLDAVQARLRSAYGERAQLQVQSPYPPTGQGGACVTLRLPLRHASEASPC